MTSIIVIPATGKPTTIEVKGDVISAVREYFHGDDLLTISATEYNKYGLPNLDMFCMKHPTESFPMNEVATSVAEAWQENEKQTPLGCVIAGAAVIVRYGDAIPISVKADDLTKYVEPYTGF